MGGSNTFTRSRSVGLLPILRSSLRITRMAPSPLGSAAPGLSTSERSQGPQYFQWGRSATTAHTASRGARECADDSTTCFAMRPSRLQPLARPGLERAHGRLEGTALLGEAVLDSHRSAVEHPSPHDTRRLLLL